MLSRLRPELRGARRVLRSVHGRHCINTRRVVRSFANYTRLSDESKPSQGASGPAKGSEGRTNPPQWLRNELEALRKKEKPGEQNESEGAVSHASEQEINAVNYYVRTGNLPSGYEWIMCKEDLPTHLKDRAEAENHPFADGTKYPFLYSPNAEVETHEMPKSMTDMADVLSSPQNHIKRLEMNIEESDKSKESKHHGSWQKRRRRAHENKMIQRRKSLPKWFYKSNVVLAQPSASQDQPGADADLAQDVTQLQKPALEPTTVEEAQKKRTWGKGREPPPDPSGSKPKPTVPTSYITNTKALKDGRYHVEASQYDELLNTFKGRLSSLKDPEKYDLALGHMTILHGATDSELLLDALVLDLCESVGADCIRLDAQDISELVRMSDAEPDFKAEWRSMVFKAYKELYGTKDSSDPFSSRQEGEENEADEDEEDEEDEESGPQGIDIPLGSFNFGGRRNPFGQALSGIGILRGTPIFGGSQDQNNTFRKLPRSMVIDTEQKSGNQFAAVFQSLLSSTTQAQKLKNAQKTEQAKDVMEGGREDKVQEAQIAKRPLIIHFQNYKLLQQHGMDTFLDQCIAAVEKRRVEDQDIMVIGTDSLRSLYDKSSAPRSILDVQEQMSYGVSTAVVLTPVYPTREAEMTLATEDRKARIRNINARHLHQALKAKGQLLHGLEDGFWTQDFKQEMGERDCEALSAQYWSYNQVQRLAALIAGNQSATPVEDACQIIVNSDESKVAWAQRNQPDIARQEHREAERQRQESKSKRYKFSTTRHEKKLLSGVIEPKKISTTFDDIHIPVETVEALKMLTTLSLQRPEAFSYGVLKSDRIPGLLLYGPPGTGKTLAAKAVAKESGATMLEVSAADLNDMYVGEGEKNVQALFSLARKLSPCVVFLDEADAMFSARASGKRASHREILNQFLKEWDGMSNDSASAFLMVATNRPMDLDDAVLRRLPRRLLVDLPTEADRHKILQIHLRNEELESTVDLADLAKKTPFYSGSDLKNVAVAAALNAVREENETAAKFRARQEQRPEDEQEEYNYPDKRILTGTHFEKALEEIGASISQDMTSLRDIKKFDEQYGDKRGRKRKSPRWGFKSAKEANQVLDTVKVRN